MKVSAVMAVAVTFFFACEKEDVKKEEIADTPVENRMATDIPPIAIGPDLVVMRIYTTMPVVNPSICGGRSNQATCGVDYRIEVDVKNIGNRTAVGYYEISVQKPAGTSPSIIRTSPTSGLVPGGMHSFSFSPSALSTCTGMFDEKELIVTCDISNTIRETNEFNNIARPYKYCAD